MVEQIALESSGGGWVQHQVGKNGDVTMQWLMSKLWIYVTPILLALNLYGSMYVYIYIYIV